MVSSPDSHEEHTDQPANMHRPSDAMAYSKLSSSKRDAIAQLSQPPQYKNESKIRIFLKLPWKDKPVYFKTHFLVPLIGALVLIGLVVFLVVRFVFPSPRPALYVAVLDDAMPLSSAQTLQSDYSQLIDEDVTIDDYFHMDDDGLSKLQTMISSEQIDVVIAPQSVFKELAGYGYFSDLSSTLTSDQQHDLHQYIASFPGYNDSDEYDSYDQSGSGKGAVEPYGLTLSDTARWDALSGSDSSSTSHQSNNADGSAESDPVMIGIVANAPDVEAARQFISYLYS